jgi:diguanylate cyclase (GGDEF)-like protein/PAS domain S-box-containing protein
LPPEAVLLRKALQERQALFSPFHIQDPGGSQLIDFITPLSVMAADKPVFFGFLVFRDAGEKSLFPALQRRPGGWRSAETLLVQNVKNSMPFFVTFQQDRTVRFVRGNSESGAHLRDFLSRIEGDGLLERPDQRGVPVLAAVERVPGCDWLLIGKVDRDEVYRPLRRLSMILGTAVLFLIGASAVGVALWWRQQMAGFAVQWLQGRLQRQTLRKHLEYLTRFANDIILLLDDQGTIVEANERAVEAYGRSREALLGTALRDLRALDSLDDFDRHWQAAYDKGVVFETRHCRADGSPFPVEVSARRVEAGGKVWCQSIIRDITERKHAEEKIRRITRLYNVLSQTNQAIVRHLDPKALFEDICRIAVELGYLLMAVITRIDLRAKKIFPIAACGAAPAFLDSIDYNNLFGAGPVRVTEHVVTTRQPYVCNDVFSDALLSYRKTAATQFDFQSVALYPLVNNGEVFGTLNFYAAEKEFFEPGLTEVLEEMTADITFALDNFKKEAARKQAEHRLLETTSTLTALYRATPLPIMIIDPEGRPTFWNPAAELVFGWSKEEVLNRPLPLVPADGKEEFMRHLARVKNGEPLRGVEVRRQRRDGTLLDMLLFTAPLYDTQDRVEGIVSLLMDITEQKKAREHIDYLAHYDPLTGLANRALLRERFEQEAARARREKRGLAFCLIDLNKFKSVNDALGHSLGDKMLAQVARRLECCLRRFDLVCRLGGDEFLVLLSGLEPSGSSGTFAGKILGKLAESFSLDGHTVCITASMGISLFPEDGEDFDTLFRNADTAMYVAKAQGNNNFLFFHREMDQKIRDRLELENSLRTALEEKRFFLHYQPQVDVVSGRIIGAEALLRFRHPQRGLIAPDKLIPIAEESGLIVPMGEWIIEEACRQLCLWRQAGLTHLSMAINLSPVQIFQENFVERVQGILANCGLPSEHLMFELTESIFMEENDQVQRTLLALKELGGGISLDDFGTGYSSLSYLKRYKVDEIKIDRAFVQDVDRDASDAAIVRATIQMAHSLGLSTVAEGVETAEQLDFLRAQRCDRYQGYLCSPPLSSEEFQALAQA